MDRYKRYRFPKAIIRFSVRYYYRYKLSLRDVSEVMLDRVIEVTYETIRLWVQTWGTFCAKAIRKHTRESGYTDKWHVDEMRVLIKGEIFCCDA